MNEYDDDSFGLFADSPYEEKRRLHKAIKRILDTLGGLMDTGRRYILDEAGNPVQEPDPLRWEDWMGHDDYRRRVAFTEIEDTGMTVSTVFLGMDHNFSQDGAPLLFETMVIVNAGTPDHEFLDEQYRYIDRQSALDGHNALVDKIRATSEGS